MADGGDVREEIKRLEAAGHLSDASAAVISLINSLEKRSFCTYWVPSLVLGAVVSPWRAGPCGPGRPFSTGVETVHKCLWFPQNPHRAVWPQATEEQRTLHSEPVVGDPLIPKEPCSGTASPRRPS